MAAGGSEKLKALRGGGIGKRRMLDQKHIFLSPLPPTLLFGRVYVYWGGKKGSLSLSLAVFLYRSFPIFLLLSLALFHCLLVYFFLLQDNTDARLPPVRVDLCRQEHPGHAVRIQGRMTSYMQKVI